MVPVGLGITVDDVVGHLLFSILGRAGAFPRATRLLGRWQGLIARFNGDFAGGRNFAPTRSAFDVLTGLFRDLAWFLDS